MISKFDNLKITIEIVILFFSLVLIKMPEPVSKLNLFFIPVSLYIIYINKDFFHIDDELKKIFYLFIIYLLFFSFYSIHWGLSFKGFYEVIVAIVFFFITLLLIDKTQIYSKLNNYLLGITISIICGNFYIGSIYSYFINPNNVAIEVFVVTMVGLLFFNKENKLSIFLTTLLLLSSLYILIEANSRNVFLGITIGIIVILNLLYRKKYSYLAQLVVLIISTIYFIFFNKKGLSLSARDDLWLSLYYYSLENNLLLGNGLNTIKIIIKEVNTITQTAHNIFLEIFVSTGIIGLTVFVYLLYKLFKYFYKQNYGKDFFFYLGVFGVVAMSIMFQFDLKFASSSFLGIFFIFLGLIYSRKISMCKKDLV